MKKDIHPEYLTSNVHCACGNEWVTRSTRGDIRVDVSSNCHPFFTGEQRIVDTAGRVERFRRRYAKAEPAADAAASVSAESAASPEAATAGTE